MNLLKPPSIDEVTEQVKDALVVSFWVPGEAAPGGSKTFQPIRAKSGKLLTKWANGKEFPMGYYRDAGKGNDAWKKTVARYAAHAMVETGHQFPIGHPGSDADGELLPCKTRLLPPLGMAVWLYQERPGTDFGRRKGEPYLKDGVPTWPTLAPDGTKLFRAVEDAMKGIVYHDDSQIIMPWPIKLYGTPAGCRIIVWKL